VFAVVVIGPPGSGKTNVLTALHDALAESDVAHAVIEVEAVGWAHPRLSDEQSFRHLESVCGAYRAAGCPLILVGATATSADYLAAVLAAIAADDYLVVRLEATLSPSASGSSRVNQPSGQVCNSYLTQQTRSRL